MQGRHCRAVKAFDGSAQAQHIGSQAYTYLGQHLLQERVAAEHLLLCDGIVVAALGCACIACGGRFTRSTLWRGLRQCSLLGVGVYLLSPLLQVCPQPWSLHLKP